MTTIDETLALAVRHHQAGRLGEAGDLYYRILNERPDHADALHLLGIVAAQVGKPELAVDLIGRAIAVDGTIPDFHASLGNALQALGRLDDALASRRRAETLTAEAALARLRDGERLQAAGRLAEAAAAFADAVAIQPDGAAAHSRLGMVLWRMGRLEEAVARHRRAVALAPESPEMAVLLAIALNDQGRPDQAAETCRRALALNAGLAEAHVILGQSLAALGQADAALAAFREAVAVRPDYAEGHKQLGAALKLRHRPLEAEACLRQALGLDPRGAGTHLELANALLDQGRPEEAVAAYRRTLELAPNHAVARGNLAYASQFLPGITLADLHRLHADWNDRHAAPLKAAGLKMAEPPRRPIPAEPGGRLRLGFVSGDFRRHPVASFIIRVLENLDRGACTVACYANQLEHDAMTARFQAAADLWRPVRGLSDDALAGQIRADGIDVLFDLTGHNARNRLGVFARRPAPLQAAWAGYMATTGLEAVDLLIADPRIVPEGAERFYAEQVIRLPDSFIAYDPPADAPPVAPLPATARGGAVTFGSFNMLGKYNDAVVAAWAAILARLPTARLLLKTRGLDEPALRARLAQRFAAHGIAPERLDLRGWSDQPGVLDYYGAIDIALDPFPFSGSTTTLEALWMGVPVLTLPGETFASRHSLSYLTAAGITGMVADSVADYVARAVALAQDLEGLAALRATLRPRMAASPLCDGKRFAGHLLEAVRGDGARGRCEGRGSSGLPGRL